MLISLENEIKLQKVIKSTNKEEEMNLISSEIENKEKNMLQYISQSYMNIIDKCNSLVEAKNRIPKILKVNETVVNSFKDIAMQLNEINAEIEIHKELGDRIKSVIDEIMKIERFFSHAIHDLEKDAIYYYNLTSNVVNLKKAKKDLFIYSFYGEINEVYVQVKNNYIEEKESLYKKWNQNNDKNIVDIGKQILNLFSNNSIAHKHIFSKLDELRKLLLSEELLIVIWMFKQENKLEDFIERFNMDRLMLIDKYLGLPDAVYRFVFEFILGFYLEKLNKGFEPHYDELIQSLNKLFFNDTKPLDLQSIKDVLVPFKNLLDYIKVENTILDQAIGKITMEFFASQGIQEVDPTKVSGEGYKDSLIQFIKESTDFISNFQNTEINEILAKKVDNNLELYLEVTDEGVLQMEKLVREVLEVCKSAGVGFISQDFSCKTHLKSKIDCFRKEKEQELELVTNELFRDKDGSFNINIQRLYSENKIVEDLVYRIIKDKFVEDVKLAAKGSEEEKRISLSRLVCFSKFLKSTNPTSYKDFDGVIQMGKSVQ